MMAADSDRPRLITDAEADADFLRSLASALTYNASKGEAVRKHRLNEIALRIASGHYSLKEIEP